MSSLVSSTNRKDKKRVFSIHEDLRNPLALLSHNANRGKTSTESSGSHITEESKKAISVLINRHERTKSELEDKNATEEKIKAEVEELRAQVQKLQSTIQDDQNSLKELNAKVEMQIQDFLAVPDTQEALFEKLIAKEGEIDRELFRLRDDRVLKRCDLWFSLMGVVDESIGHPDQTSRDENLLMRKELYTRTKRNLAQDTRARLLSEKEDFQRQKFEISQANPEGHLLLLPASPISEDSDQRSVVPDIHQEEVDDQVDGSSVEYNTTQDTSWITENREESSNVLGLLFSDDSHIIADDQFAAIEENKILKEQLETTQEQIGKWEGEFESFQASAKETIERLSSKVSSTNEALREYKNALDGSYDVRGRLVHDLAKVEEEKARLLQIAQDIALPILARSAESMKQVKRDGVHIALNNSHLSFNKTIVRAGNIATTGGHVNAHFASIVLSEKDVITGPVISYEMFLKMYGVSVGEYRNVYEASDKLDEMLNMHAILVECGSFTEKTLSKTRDTLFKTQFAQCLLEFEAIDAPTSEDKGRIFDAAVRAKEVEVFNEMAEITQDIQRLHKVAI
ncbi:hypothetical protein SBOR_1948 [Sclerotinia borealis F-4128]|uniref:Uncharacterized protein n=1 Tax=Sclerotinia borealis (strain F-4128) TaxID=1432307 RepID=W9CP74_SCLBF|nr:hypothetical protein SBOR_1948 [Sclerotinia borealis F-4128]